MMRTYLIIMAIAIFIIGLALAVKVFMKWLNCFKEDHSFWCKLATCLNLIAVLTVASGVGILFLQVADFLK